MSKDSGIRNGANKVKKKVFYWRIGSSEKVFSFKITIFWAAFFFFHKRFFEYVLKNSFFPLVFEGFLWNPGGEVRNLGDKV